MIILFIVQAVVPQVNIKSLQVCCRSTMIILFIVQAVVPQVNIKYVVDQQWLFYL